MSPARCGNCRLSVELPLNRMDPDDSEVRCLMVDMRIGRAAPPCIHFKPRKERESA
jgi:hypothetical protein